MDTSTFREDAKTTFIIVNAICTAIILYKLVMFCYAPSLTLEGDSKGIQILLTFIHYSFDYFSFFYFWYLFGMTAYWFIFFKLEERVFLLLPALDTYADNYEPFIIIFGLTASLKFVTIIYKIIFDSQTNFDVFLIDWERPKYKSKKVGQKDKESTYAGRRIFVMNELNEL